MFRKSSVLQHSNTPVFQHPVLPPPIQAGESATVRMNKNTRLSTIFATVVDGLSRTSLYEEAHETSPKYLDGGAHVDLRRRGDARLRPQHAMVAGPHPGLDGLLCQRHRPFAGRPVFGSPPVIQTSARCPHSDDPELLISC
jgi:hypothetical protein